MNPTEKTKVVVSGPTMPVCGLLGIAFVVLKLCGVIGWSWWWVTAPFWAPLVLVVGFIAGFLLVCGICLAVAAIVSKFCGNRRTKR